MEVKNSVNNILLYRQTKIIKCVTNRINVLDQCMANYEEFAIHLGSILGLGVTLGSIWIWGSLCVHFWSGGHFGLILGLRVTFGPSIWANFRKLESLRVQFCSWDLFCSILGLGVTLGSLWVWGSLCAHFRSWGRFGPISGLGVTLGLLAE